MERAYKLEFGGEKTGNLYLNCCGLSKTEPLHSFGPALKPNYLIHYVLDGQGKLVIGGKEYKLSAGYGFLITPDELAFYQSSGEDPWTYVWVGFSGSNAGPYMEELGLSVTHPVFESDKSDEIYKSVKDMIEHNTYGLSDELRRNGQLGVFLSIIADSIAVEDRDESNRADTYVTKAITFIRNNYYNPIKITDIADYVCINRSYLYTLFERATNMSPQKFLTKYRMMQARELLRGTDLSIEAVAISCGYSDPLVFTKAFRSLEGMSPSSFRKEIRTGKISRNEEELRELEHLLEKI